MRAYGVTQAAPFQSTASETDGTLQRGIGNYHSGPEVFQQFSFADDPVLMRDKIHQQVKDPRLQPNAFTLEAQFPGIGIQFKTGKAFNHEFFPSALGPRSFDQAKISKW